MKGIQGLIVAIVLGLIGAGVNLKYLHDQARMRDKVSFVMVKDGKQLKQGEIIRRDNLDTFDVPGTHAGQLKKIAYEAGMEGTIVGRKAIRDYDGGQLILQEDLRTAPAPELRLNPGEVAVWVPVDNRRFVADFVIPGRTPVSFRLPRVASNGGAQSLSADLEEVGPFDVLSVGNRLGTLAAMKPENIRAVQENVLTIRASFQNRQLDKKSARVLDYLSRTSYRPLEVVLHPEAAAK